MSSRATTCRESLWAWFENDQVIYRRTAGELVAGSGEKVSADTLFKIASNTKAMTTAVMARLVDAGKLRWEDPVVRYLPHFQMYDPWVTREMQVRDLVIHNSGLRSGAGDLMLWPEPNAFTRADVIAGLAHLRPVHSFRSHYDYDNLLYIVAGEAAAAAGGASYEELLRREVFEPLQMRRCQVGEFRRDEVGDVAQPHMRQGEINVPIRRDGEIVPAVTMAAAGGVRCSLNDMLTWVRMWLADDSKRHAWLTRCTARSAVDGAYAHAALATATRLGQQSLQRVRLRLASVRRRRRAARGAYGNAGWHVLRSHVASRKGRRLCVHDQRRSR